MSKLHNKKRNVGIIYEQIVSFICDKLIENDKKSADSAVKIIKKHFQKESQLYKEYKLFKALSSTHNVSEHLATSIIHEAKNACNKMFNNNVLEKEKSNLIKDLNYTFGKGKIFEEKVNNYRIYATIQTLLNEWRNNTNNFDKLTEYEIILHESLTTKSEQINERSIKVPLQVDYLTHNLMKNKFNENYTHNLSEHQKNIVHCYINESDEVVTEMFVKEKKDCLDVLNNYILNCNNKILKQKNRDVIQKITNINESIIDKNNLQKFLIISKLKEEVLGE